MLYRTFGLNDPRQMIADLVSTYGYLAVFVGTIVKRSEPHIYVANWFFLSFILTVAMLHLVNNLNILDHFEILLVVALGKPQETVVLETVGPDGDIKYWRDSEGMHHVPKRSLEDIIVG